MGQNLAYELLLLLGLHIANDSAFVVVRFSLLGKLHDYERPISRRFLGEHRTLIGYAAILATGIAVFSLLLGRFVPFPSLGILAGISTNSFIKRRLGIRPGMPLPLFDQLDFFAGGAAGLALSGVYFSNLAAMALLSFIIHACANVAAYLMGFKKVWW